MNTHYLCLERKQSRKRLLIFDRLALDRYCSENAEQYRISPIFPVVPSDGVLPKNKGKYTVAFFIFDRPYSAIATLLKVLQKKEHCNLWFSHGLCSLIVFSKKDNLIKQIKSETANCVIRGVEIWKVRGSEIIEFAPELSPPTKFKISDFAIDYSGFEPDVTSVIYELAQGLNTAVRLAAQFIPSELDVFKRLAEAARHIILELRFLYSPDANSPKSFSKSAIKKIRRDEVERQRMIHQRIGHLVQINSAFSYVISQAFSGTIPLIESDCQTKSFSFLGIGSAYRALAAFSRFTESIFQENPIDDVISKKFQNVEPLEIHTDLEKHYLNVNNWTNPQWSVDAHIKSTAKIEKKYNLVYFSGRLGFREAEFAITAALQVLTNACTAPWSLMTFTHEMMHAHVRGLLSAIFTDTTRKFRFESHQEIFERFYDYLESPLDGRMPESFLDSLRFLILSYCGYRRLLRDTLRQQKKTGKSKYINGKDGAAFPKMNELDEEFGISNREINEIIVHVLDFNYFYNGHAGTYIGLLWQSWLPVPAVLEDVQNYLWRSLLALTSQQSGNARSRFDAAHGLLVNTLRGLNAPNNALIQHALDYLKDSDNRDTLLLRFEIALPLVDMVQKFLCSTHIHAQLFDDENGKEGENGCQYTLEAGEFKNDIIITSPISLAADRLRRALSNEQTNLENSHVAAWFFLACSESHYEKGHE